MSTTPARLAPLRVVGTLLVAAALVTGPAIDALAEPTGDPSPSVSTSATAEPSPSAPTASAEPVPTTSPSADPTPSATGPASAPSPTATRSTSATPAPSEAGDERVAAASPAQLAEAAAAAVPQAAYAADFVARTLAAGDDHYVYPGSTFFDGGNTIDAILALDGAGAGSAQADASFSYLEDNVGGYIGTDFASTYAGPTAKALLAVVAHGGDPTAFGGLDLVDELRATEGAVEPGRFSDLPVDCGFPTCDFSNTIGQSLAVMALVRAGESVSTASVDVLLAQQCADGGFRGTIGGATCVSDPDATAFAAQALIAAGAAAAAAEALDALAADQGSDGGFESADGITNANTTGVAAQAFAAGGRATELAEAQAFLVSLQYACSSPASLRGGLAFSASTRSATAPSDTDLRATPQATLGLAGQSLLSVTADGATSGTTSTPCTTTPPTTTPTSGTDPTEGSGSGDSLGTDVASGPTGSLAQTGTDLLLPVGVGLALVLLGALAVVASRRRGAHA